MGQISQMKTTPEQAKPTARKTKELLNWANVSGLAQLSSFLRLFRGLARLELFWSRINLEICPVAESHPIVGLNAFFHTDALTRRKEMNT